MLFHSCFKSGEGLTGGQPPDRTIMTHCGKESSPY